jgi:hypothetical protein
VVLYYHLTSTSDNLGDSLVKQNDQQWDDGQKLKLSHYRPWVGPWGSRRLGLPGFLRQSALESGRVVSPTHRPLIPPRKDS